MHKITAELRAEEGVMLVRSHLAEWPALESNIEEGTKRNQSDTGKSEPARQATQQT